MDKNRTRGMFVLSLFMLLGGLKLVQDISFRSKSFMDENDVLSVKRLDDEPAIRFIASQIKKEAKDTGPKALEVTDTKLVNGTWKVYRYTHVDGQVEDFRSTDSEIPVKLKMKNLTEVILNGEQIWNISFLRNDEDMWKSRIVLFSDIKDEQGKSLGFEILEARRVKLRTISEDIKIEEAPVVESETHRYILTRAQDPEGGGLILGPEKVRGSVEISQDHIFDLTATLPRLPLKKKGDKEAKPREDLRIEIAESFYSNKVFTVDDHAGLIMGYNLMGVENAQFNIIFTSGAYNKVKLIFIREDVQRKQEQETFDRNINNEIANDEEIQQDEVNSTAAAPFNSQGLFQGNEEDLVAQRYEQAEIPEDVQERLENEGVEF